MGFDRLYYQYIPEGKEYPVLCRKLSTGRKGWVNTIVNSFREEIGREQILLDWNDIAEQYGKFSFYYSLPTCQISSILTLCILYMLILSAERLIFQVHVLPHFSSYLVKLLLVCWKWFIIANILCCIFLFHG